MRADEETEFRQYVAARAERLRRFAYLCCGDWHRAEDAVQSALIRLYGVWAGKSPDSVDRYVRRIVTNILIDEHRRGWFRRERVSHLVPDRPVPDATESSVETLRIMSALARLPRRQRAVVVLRFWEDLSVEQVGEILRCSTGTVKSQSARGLRTLRALLADSLPDRSVGASS
jgi:RNA polymerase sigma-70 factor (sigma-E family)